MVHTQLFTYHVQKGEPALVSAEGTGDVGPPDRLPGWQWTEENRVTVIFIYDPKPVTAVQVTVDVSPAIIKGWAIYQMEKVRLMEGGMIGDKRAVFTVQRLTPQERVRIDILAKGPRGKAQVTVTEKRTKAMQGQVAATNEET